MKRLIIVFLFLGAFLNCSSSQEQYLQANLAYKNKDYKKALENYESLDDKSSSVWYNMGNAAYKLEQYLNSMVYYRRALKDASWNQRRAINRNINLVYSKLGKPQAVGFWQSLYQDIAAIPLLFTQLIFLIVWLILCFVLLRHMHRRLVFIAVLVALNLFAGIILVTRYRARNNQSIVIMKDGTLYAGPDTHFAAVGKVSKTDEMSLSGERDGWVKVKNAGQIGWIPVEWVEKI